jgi:ribosomal protein S18 acetylase RimI-like enzyme
LADKLKATPARHGGADRAFDAGDHHPLDEVVWRALGGVQQRFSRSSARARRYLPAVAPFAATADLDPASFQSLLGLMGPADDRVALVTPEEIDPPAPFSVARRGLIDQMMLVDQAACPVDSRASIVTLGEGDVAGMLALTAATQPGPFGPRTNELGQYLGVRHEGALIAMAGERMRLRGFTEVSAVCVADAHRGQGLAAALVGRLVASILGRGETPFLHVFTSNQGAIALYRKLGFALRRQLHLAVMVIDDGSPTP